MSEEPAEYNIEKTRRDNAILKKYAAIQKASEDKIGCQKIYVDMVDDIPAALVLDEIIFFTLPRANTGKSALRVRKDGYLWMAVRRAEWWDRKRLKEREADLAIAKLEKLGLIIKSVHRFNSLPTVHLRLNVDTFFRLYFEVLERDNPPEDENDTDLSDINDLYEMMEIPFSPNRKLPNGEGRLPNGDESLPNGESINSPYISPTQNIGTDVPFHPARQELDEIEASANLKVDKILEQNEVARQRESTGQAWRGRELTPPNYLIYGDWWHAKTGLHMYGVKGKAKMDTGWLKEFKEWYENEVSLEALDEAYEANRWRTISKPVQITADAKKIQVAPIGKVSQPEREQGKPFYV